jgi:tryptophanyl-tRNA synthetase
MRVLSGVQTSGTGELHIGNYLGAIKQWIELQDGNDVFYMLANLHAITVPIDPEAAKENVYKIAALYLALGLDPKKATIFVQSLVHEHAELAWLLNNIAYMGEMRRMTQFKDKAGDDQEGVTVGLFDYPVLMAADILLYQAGQVPVGDDQKQHLELTRNLAERFNNKYGQTFTVPEYYAPKEGARIMGLNNPDKKMSKSLGPDNYISLLDTPEQIREKMKKAVTDSDNLVKFDKENKPGVSNLLVIFSAVANRSIEDLENDYGSTGYGRFKNDLAEALISFLTPIQEKYHTVITDRAMLDEVLSEGSKKAQAVAAQTLEDVKTKMGIL